VYSQPAEFAFRCAQAYRDFNAAVGRPLTAPVDEADRSRIRTNLARVMFVETHSREPLDARELSGHLARISRRATTAVAGYDLTFPPVKSVSVLWAIAPRDVAQQIERAHQDAVGDTLRWLEDNATYTRRGRGGVAQVDVTGLVATAFTHRDSRAGDPDLHTHVAISNKVQALGGTWLALDGRQLYQANVAASERYNTRLETLLGDQLGIVFAERPDGEPGKRPVREIGGIDGPLPHRWSTRRADIDTRRAVLASKFQDDHGRPPNAKEAVALGQQATLETRAAKHEPRSHAEQRATWRTEAVALVGGNDQLSAYVHTALHPPVRRTVDVTQHGWRRQRGPWSRLSSPAGRPGRTITSEPKQSAAYAPRTSLCPLWTLLWTLLWTPSSRGRSATASR
jgi:conjugative relaxase-like TrwC/TraI family protein